MSLLQRCWLICAVSLLLVAIATGQVQAMGVMVEPAFQFVTITASESSTTRAITFTNQTDIAQTYLLSTADIRQLDTQGQVAYVDKPQTDSSYALASFLRLPVAEITLQPGEKQAIEVEIADNQNLSPGGHYGAVLAQVVSVGAEGEEVILPMVSSVLLVHKVGGERFHINLKRVEIPAIWLTIPKSMLLEFENQGNVHVVPHGQVTIEDVFGRRIAEGIINEGSVVVMPENQRAISVNIAARSLAIPLVPLTLKIAGTAQSGELSFTQSGAVEYLPIWSGIVILGTLIIGGILIRYLRRYVKIKR